jgi:hypothetical protein
MIWEEKIRRKQNREVMQVQEKHLKEILMLPGREWAL